MNDEVIIEVTPTPVPGDITSDVLDDEINIVPEQVTGETVYVIDYAGRNIKDTPLIDYTVTEALLLLIFFVSFVSLIFKKR